MTISDRQRAALVGVLILVAYSVLTYSITENVASGVATDILSGLAVIGISLLMYPVFGNGKHRTLNQAYMGLRLIEGLLMIGAGLILLSPSLRENREDIYEFVQIYFFIGGALVFYALLHRTVVVPKFISVWGFLATLVLLLITVIRLFGVSLTGLDFLLAPVVLNEFFLAGWLMVKGFTTEAVTERDDLIEESY